MTIENSSFENLNSTNQGGAISLIPLGSNFINIKSSSFTNLSASQGGSIYSQGSNLSFIGCSFSFCSANGTNKELGAEGGAIFSLSSNYLTIKDSTFVSNTANTNGGAIHWYGKQPLLESLSYFNNQANYGDNIASYAYTMRLSTENQIICPPGQLCSLPEIHILDHYSNLKTDDNFPVFF